MNNTLIKSAAFYYFDKIYSIEAKDFINTIKNFKKNNKNSGYSNVFNHLDDAYLFAAYEKNKTQFMFHLINIILQQNQSFSNDFINFIFYDISNFSTKEKTDFLKIIEKNNNLYFIPHDTFKNYFFNSSKEENSILFKNNFNFLNSYYSSIIEDLWLKKEEIDINLLNQTQKEKLAKNLFNSSKSFTQAKEIIQNKLNIEIKLNSSELGDIIHDILYEYSSSPEKISNIEDLKQLQTLMLDFQSFNSTIQTNLIEQIIMVLSQKEYWDKKPFVDFIKFLETQPIMQQIYKQFFAQATYENFSNFINFFAENIHLENFIKKGLSQDLPQKKIDKFKTFVFDEITNENYIDKNFSDFCLKMIDIFPNTFSSDFTLYCKENFVKQKNFERIHTVISSLEDKKLLQNKITAKSKDKELFKI